MVLEHRPVLTPGREGAGPKALGSNEATEPLPLPHSTPRESRARHPPVHSLTAPTVVGLTDRPPSSQHAFLWAWPALGVGAPAETLRTQTPPAGPGWTRHPALDVCRPTSTCPVTMLELGGPDPSHPIQASWTLGLNLHVSLRHRQTALKAPKGAGGTPGMRG